MVTAGFSAWDTYQYAAGNISGKEYSGRMAINGLALTADLATGGMGGGLAVRGASLAGRGGALLARTGRAGQVVGRGTRLLAKGYNAYDNATSIAGGVVQIYAGLTADECDWDQVANGLRELRGTGVGGGLPPGSKAPGTALGFADEAADGAADAARAADHAANAGGRLLAGLHSAGGRIARPPLAEPAK